VEGVTVNKYLLIVVLVSGGILFRGVALGSFYSSMEGFFLYYPSTSFINTTDDYNLAYEESFFGAEDGVQLHGWLFPLKEKDGPVLLLYHGNAGNISHRLDLIRRLKEVDIQVFIFDYRGYGRSGGKPSEHGLYRDGLAAYDYLVNQGFRPENIILFGRSLGAAVAIETAIQRQVRAVILEGAFTSTKDMARTIPLIGLLSPLLPAHFNNLEKIKAIDIPKLFIHGERDDIVPFIMGEQLFEAARPPKQFYVVPKAGHNDTYFVGGSDYFSTILEFIRP
jgi:fermentation-respiration switch protein FrsA (DUF1100 family)